MADIRQLKQLRGLAGIQALRTRDSRSQLVVREAERREVEQVQHYAEQALQVEAARYEELHRADRLDLDAVRFQASAVLLAERAASVAREDHASRATASEAARERHSADRKVEQVASARMSQMRKRADRKLDEKADEDTVEFLIARNRRTRG